MTRIPAPGRTPHRGGFALPLVLVSATAALVIALAAATLAWRAHQGARLALTTARMDLAAERALARGIDAAQRDSILNRALGDSTQHQWHDEDGLPIAVVARRSSPLVAWLTATAGDGRGAAPTAARAVRTRVLRLGPPPWPVRAAVVSSTPIDSSSARVHSSTAPEHASCQDTDRPAPPALALPEDTLRTALTPGWSVAQSRATRWSGDAPNDNRWRAATIAAADSVVGGSHRWTGLLIHDGPLRLGGALTLHGLLVVRGPLDARAGRLTIVGALLVQAPPPSVVQLGPAQLRWDPCAAAMALATIADLHSAPFFVWSGVTP